METIVKLNARGRIMYVDEAILAKSHYFRHVLNGDGFQKSLPDEEGAYYVDCDHDVMTELIAYMETGSFKYKRIDSKYMSIMLDKYCITKETTHENNYIEKINQMFTKLIKFIAKNVTINETDTIQIKSIDCNSEEIEIMILNKEKTSFLRHTKGIVIIGIKYNSDIYSIYSIPKDKQKKMINNLLNTYKLDKTFYIKNISLIRGLVIVFEKFPETFLQITNEDSKHNVDSNSGEDDQ